MSQLGDGRSKSSGIPAGLAAYLIVLGRQIRDSYDTAIHCGAGCTLATARDTLENDYFTTLLLCGFLIVLVPALIGAWIRELWRDRLLARLALSAPRTPNSSPIDAWSAAIPAVLRVHIVEQVTSSEGVLSVGDLQIVGEKPERLVGG